MGFTTRWSRGKPSHAVSKNRHWHDGSNGTREAVARLYRATAWFRMRCDSDGAVWVQANWNSSSDFRFCNPSLTKMRPCGRPVAVSLYRYCSALMRLAMDLPGMHQVVRWVVFRCLSMGITLASLVSRYAPFASRDVVCTRILWSCFMICRCLIRSGECYENPAVICCPFAFDGFFSECVHDSFVAHLDAECLDESLSIPGLLH